MAPEPEDFNHRRGSGPTAEDRAHEGVRRGAPLRRERRRRGDHPGDPGRAPVPGPGGPPRRDRRWPDARVPSRRPGNAGHHRRRPPPASTSTVTAPCNDAGTDAVRPLTRAVEPAPMRRRTSAATHTSRSTDYAASSLALRAAAERALRALGSRGHVLRQRRNAACLVTPNAAPTSPHVAPSERARDTSSPARPRS